jgi:hypothetical protein
LPEIVEDARKVEFALRHAYASIPEDKRKVEGRDYAGRWKLILLHVDSSKDERGALNS